MGGPGSGRKKGGGKGNNYKSRVANEYRLQRMNTQGSGKSRAANRKLAADTKKWVKKNK
jgi:hypothetical protein